MINFVEKHSFTLWCVDFMELIVQLTNERASSDYHWLRTDYGFRGLVQISADRWHCSNSLPARFFLQFSRILWFSFFIEKGSWRVLTSNTMAVQMVASIGCVLPDAKAMSLELETVFLRTRWTSVFNSTEAFSHSLRMISTTASKRRLPPSLLFCTNYQPLHSYRKQKPNLCKLGCTPFWRWDPAQMAILTLDMSEQALAPILHTLLMAGQFSENNYTDHFMQMRVYIKQFVL